MSKSRVDESKSALNESYSWTRVSIRVLQKCLDYLAPVVTFKVTLQICTEKTRLKFNIAIHEHKKKNYYQRYHYSVICLQITENSNSVGQIPTDLS